MSNSCGVCVAELGVRFPDDSADDIHKQKQLLKDAAAFLVSCQIPSLVRGTDNRKTPFIHLFPMSRLPPPPTPPRPVIKRWHCLGWECNIKACVL